MWPAHALLGLVLNLPVFVELKERLWVRLLSKAWREHGARHCTAKGETPAARTAARGPGGARFLTVFVVPDIDGDALRLVARGLQLRRRIDHRHHLLVQIRKVWMAKESKLR